MSSGPRVLFRVEAGPQAGLGHLKRSLALALALRSQGVDSHFLSAEDPFVRQEVERSGFPCWALDGVPSGSENDLKKVLSLARSQRVSAVVVDSYLIQQEYLSRLRKAHRFVLAIDDLARFTFPCPLVVNPGLQARELTYRSVYGDTRFLLGPRYALLAPEFSVPPPRRLSDRVRNVLIALGSADPQNLMGKLLDLLDRMPERFTLTAVLGPFFSHQDRLRRLAKGLRRKVQLVEAPSSLLRLILKADCAISAAGQTLLELVASGTPTLGLELADNQRLALAAQGAVKRVGRPNDPDFWENLKAGLGTLIASPRTRRNLHKAGRRLVDGKGAMRVGEVFLQELNDA